MEPAHRDPRIREQQAHGPVASETIHLGVLEPGYSHWTLLLSAFDVDASFDHFQDPARLTPLLPRSCSIVALCGAPDV
jgi:hypothetical protein